MLIAHADQLAQLDARHVTLLGINLRGGYSVQVATHQPDIAAINTVTVPHRPLPSYRHLNQIVQNEIAYMYPVADPERILDMVDSMPLVDTASRLKSPLMVVGAGDDLMVPPAQSNRLCAAASEETHLHFIPGANHVAFSHLSQWTPVASAWIRNVMNERADTSGRQYPT